MRKKRKGKSISSMVPKLYAASMLVLVAVFVMNGIFIYCSAHRNADHERAYQLHLAAGEVNSRMKKTEEKIAEALTAVINDYRGLWSNGENRKVLDKQALNRYITNQKIATGSLEYVFAFRPGDFTIFQGNIANTIFDHLAVKDYVLENGEAISTTVKKNGWSIVEIGGESYAVLCYHYDYIDIYMGVAVKAETLFSDIITLADGIDGSFEAVSEGGGSFFYSASGKAGFAGATRLEEPLEGGVELKAEFALDILGLIRNDLIAVTLIGLVVCLSTIYITNWLLREKVVEPLKSISAAVRDISDQTRLIQLPEQSDVIEIEGLVKALNGLLRDAVYNRAQLYDSAIQKKEQELIMLRAQRRPHFFLNAITTVNAMTYQNRNDDIREYLMRLSDFMRYTITSTSDVVTLREELENIKNYFQMQDIRYPSRVMTFVECAEEVADIEMPRFLLLTVVENAFKYALYMDGAMQLYIQCMHVAEEGFDGVSIVAEDNGQGFSEEQLRYFNQPELPRKTADPHIGIVNIKETLRLYYGRTDLLTLSNATPNGAIVRIRIPYGKKEGMRENEDSDS